MTRYATADLRLPGLARSGCCGGASGTRRDALNGTAAPRTKTEKAELGGENCAPARPRRLWVSVAIALVAIGLVLTGELWVFREAPALANTAQSEVATELDSTLANVVAASILIAPADQNPNDR